MFVDSEVILGLFLNRNTRGKGIVGCHYIAIVLEAMSLRRRYAIEVVERPRMCHIRWI